MSMGLDLAKMALANEKMQAESKNLGRTAKNAFVHELREVGRVDGIPILTIETRMEKREFEFPGASGAEVSNLGFNQTWEHKAHLKNKAFKKYIDVAVEHDPDMLVVMVDGGDVIWGGCDAALLRSTYEATVKGSRGAKVVLGAEFQPGPKTMMRACMRKQHNKEPFESNRRAVLQALGKPVVNRSWDLKFEKDYWGELWGHVDYEFDYIDDMYADRTRCDMHRSFCSNPPKYQFANYGFIMGPVSGLKPLIDLIVEQQAKNPELIDQQVALAYHLEHPDLVTLDYSGTMMLSMHNFLGDLSGNIPSFLKIDAPNHKVINEITGKDQCFLHGNGRAKPLLGKLAQEMEVLFKEA